MDIASRHPVIEGGVGGVLTGLGTAIHFANDWLTPALSFITALVGFVFSMHAVYRWHRRRKGKDSRATDRP